MQFSGDEKKSQLKITQTDREWVEQSFLSFVKIFGIPLTGQLSLSGKDFPHTFKEKEEIKVEGLIHDFCVQLKLDRNLFRMKFFVI